MIGSTILIPLIQLLEIFCFVRRAEDVRVGRVRLLDAHLVGEPGTLHVLRHFPAAAKLVDERLIEPRLVDAQAGIRKQAVSIEPLDVVALERAAISPDVHVIFFHRDHQHGAGDRAADRRRVEVRNAGRRDVKSARLQRGNPLVDQLAPAIDEPRLFGAVLPRAPWNLVVILFVGLPQIRGVRVRNRALCPASNEGLRSYRGRRKMRCRPSGRLERSEESSPSGANDINARGGWQIMTRRSTRRLPSIVAAIGVLHRRVSVGQRAPAVARRRDDRAELPRSPVRRSGRPALA